MFGIAAFFWLDSYHLIRLDRRRDLKPKPGIICRSLLFNPHVLHLFVEEALQVVMGSHDEVDMSMSTFPKLTDYNYLQILICKKQAPH